MSNNLNKNTLPSDSQERKQIPLFSGVLRYFPAALMGVARVSKKGNDQHNPGQPLYHNRSKSSDHGDCLLRHLVDVQDMLNQIENPHSNVKIQDMLDEISSVAWRALAYSQELHEKYGAPLAPGAKFEKEPTRLELTLEIERLLKDPEVQAEVKRIAESDGQYIPIGAGHE